MAIFIFVCIVAVCSIILCAFICSAICRSTFQSRDNLDIMVRANSLNLSASSIRSNAAAAPWSFSIVSMGFTLLCICLYTLQNALDPFAYYTRFMSSPNYYYMHITYNLAWISAKLSFYVLLMHRYYLIFDAANLQLTNEPFLLYKKLCILGTFCTVLFTQLLLYFAVFIVYDEVVSQLKQYACIALLCLDLLIITGLAYLFTTSIVQSVIQIQSEKEKESMLTHRRDISNKYKHDRELNVDDDHCLFGHEAEDEEDEDMDFKCIKPSFSMTADHANNDHNPFVNHVSFHVRDCSNMSHMTNCSMLEVSTETAPTDRDYFQSVATSPNSRRVYGENTTPRHLPLGTVNILNLHAADSHRLTPQLRPDHTISSIRYKYESTASSMPEYMPSAKLSQAAVDVDEQDAEKAVKMKKYEDHYNKKQMKILNVTTRICLTSCIALLSSFVYEVVLLVAFECNHHEYSRVVWFNVAWCLHALITIVCVYLQTEMAKPVYHALCIRCLKCHRCSFKLLHAMAMKRVYTIHHSQSAISMVAQSSGDSCNQSPTLEPQELRIEIDNAVQN
eukprot:CAMPEP_0197044998 /NCGR_PEP_ID=MMETSP1384-20130603/20948_1 /TAXON_ID=29189 /ORGANISM="Ammonia sp." /LENGTH=560 /DNA_ID=CAMNT_0042476543 /DNA_START=1 /DNA_END=1683 /DNA_ORIENTATION=+